MSEFKIPALPAAPAAAQAEGAAAGASSSSGAPLPQDLAMILELMGPPSPGLPAAKESAEEVIARIEAGRLSKAPSAATDAAAAENEPEEGKVSHATTNEKAEESDSDSLDSSSESDSSSSSSVSSASRSVGAGPSAAIVASHNRNAKAVTRLTREDSPADSEPDLDPDFFKSANELPAPTAAPPLPFERIPEGQGSKELGKIKSVVGKLMIIEHRAGGLGRGQGSDDILGEGTVVCWKDGRVLGIVNDTFGPLTAPMYTLILPDPFAPPTAPAEDDDQQPAAAAAAQPEGSASQVKAAVSDVSPPAATEAEAAIVERSAETTVATSDVAPVPDGATDGAVAPTAASPAKSDDLEVEALVQADEELPSPAGTHESPMPTSPLPVDSDLPASPPAPHRPLPPAFPKADLVGLTVYYPVQLSNRVPVAQLKRQRWTDASNKFDEECGEEEMDWSDDEAEAAAKRRRKLSRGSKAGSVRGGSPTPSMGSQWGGSHFDANSDDEGTVLNYSAMAEAPGAASLPKRPMPVAYDDLDASEYRGEGSSGATNGAARGGKKRERGGAIRGKGKERATDGPSSRGGFESSRGGGRGGARGGARGGFDAGRGIARPRGRGGAMGSLHSPHLPYELQQQQQQQQQQQAPPRPAAASAPQPPARPMSPTSMAIARATGQYPSGAQAPPGGPGQGPPSGMPFPVRPYFPQAGFPYPSPYGQPMAPYGRQSQPPQQQPQQQQQHAFGGPAPGAHMPYSQPPFGYPGMYGVPHGQMASGQPQHNPALQQALQQQQAEHNKQLLEMQRQIALLSRKQAGGGAPPSGGGAGGGQQ